jgi:hypothetical protein
MPNYLRAGNPTVRRPSGMNTIACARSFRESLTAAVITLAAICGTGLLSAGSSQGERYPGGTRTPVSRRPAIGRRNAAGSRPPAPSSGCHHTPLAALPPPGADTP